MIWLRIKFETGDSDFFFGDSTMMWAANYIQSVLDQHNLPEVAPLRAQITFGRAVAGAPASADLPLTEGDEVTLIRRGESPDRAELEALMAARLLDGGVIGRIGGGASGGGGFLGLSCRR